MKTCTTCGKEWPDDYRLCPNDGSTLRAHAGDGELVDTIIADRYHVIEKLGQGGMGAVYRAEHVKMGQQAAIKVINRALASDPAAIARFTREARNAAQIKHPNVCMIHDFGETQDGLIYMAMEYIEGESLADLLRRQGALPLDRAARILMQCCDALQAAHDLQIVHRDVKPENIMITKARDGADVVKVVDFGIAKAVAGEAGQKVTQTGYVVGTPDYMSPDQVTGAALDGRSDIYSLAVVFFRMVTGTLPFQTETPHDALMARFAATPIRLQEALPSAGFAPELQAVLDRAMERRREDRYGTAIEFGKAVLRAVGVSTGEQPTVAFATDETRRMATPQPSLAPTVPEHARSEATAVTPETPQPRRAPPRAVKKGSRVAVAAAAVAILGGAVAVWQLSSGGSPAAETAPDVASGETAETTSGAAGQADIGTVTFSDMPPGATVLEAGRELSPPYELSEGHHALELRAPGYENTTVEVDVVAGERTTVMYAARRVEQRAQTGARTEPEGQPRATGGGRNLTVGQTVSGRLSGSDPAYPQFNGRRAQTWTIQSPGTTPVVITMRSTDFDAFLYLTGPGLSQPLSNDDGGGTRDAQIATTLARGTYTIAASPYATDGTGTYTLSVTAPGAAPTFATEGRTLQMGRRASGTLTANAPPFQGRNAQAWALTARAGTRVQIDMRSEAFDPYLFLTGPGFTQPLTDDDGGDGTNARLTATLVQGGTYYVLASSFSSGTGAYTVEVTAPRGLEEMRVDSRVLTPGAALTRTLTLSDPLYEGRHVQVFELEAPQGTRVLVRVQSDAFDTYLYATGPGLSAPLTDDDGGGGTNSQLTFTVGPGGRYRIAVGGFTESAVGAYRLSVFRQQ